MKHTPFKRGQLTIKRAFDVFVAGGLLIVLSPVYLIVSLLVRKQLGAPVVFEQQRPGLHGEIFTVQKFRTMINETVDKNGKPLTDAERVTPFGQFLRKTSLDELPQLRNVLRGEMSLVGPRPLLVSYLDKYSPEQARRHDMRPGITGWAQVNGRNYTKFSQRFRLDVWYIDHWSLLLDMKILWMTLRNLLRRNEVVTGQATEEFDDLGFLETTPGLQDELHRKKRRVSQGDPQ